MRNETQSYTLITKYDCRPVGQISLVRRIKRRNRSRQAIKHTNNQGKPHQRRNFLDDTNNFVSTRKNVAKWPRGKTIIGTCITIHNITRNIIQERFLSSLSQMPNVGWGRICPKRNTWRDMRKPLRSSIIVEEGCKSRVLLAVHTNGRQIHLSRDVINANNSPTCFTYHRRN